MGTGGDLDLLHVLIGIGVQLILGGVLVKVLDTGAAIDPEVSSLGAAILYTAEGMVLIWL